MHLIGCLYYLYQWCTVKQISDNEIYLLIKYIRSVLWRVVRCLSYIEEARCLKVKKGWRYTSTPRIRLHVVDRDTLILFYLLQDVTWISTYFRPGRLYAQILTFHSHSFCCGTRILDLWIILVLALTVRVFYCVFVCCTQHILRSVRILTKYGQYTIIAISLTGRFTMDHVWLLF